MAVIKSKPDPRGEAGILPNETPKKLIRRRRRITSPTIHVTGIALLFLGPGMLIAALFEWFYDDPLSHNEGALLLSAAIVMILGGLMAGFSRTGTEMRPTSVFSVVAWTWIASSIGGALPYLFGNMFTWSNWDGALFESISGFSCTGSTVLPSVEDNGKGLLIWRQITQWYGGMGMVVLAVTVLPFLGVGGLSLMSAEAPGVSSDRLMPRVSETARRLWVLYGGITLLIMIAFWLTPQMNFYDAFGHSLATAATGGFSMNNYSIGHYDSVLVEVIAMVAMMLGAMNFSLHYRAVRGDLSGYWKSADHVVFFMIIGFGTVTVTLLNWSKGAAGFGASLRHGLFNIITLATSTGFGSATSDDFSMGNFTAFWTPSALVILLILMLIGGNVGSTAGGAKVWRMQVAVSHMIRQLQLTRHPRGVIPVKIGRQAIPDDVVNRVLGFLGLHIIITVVGTIILSAMGADPVTAGSGALSAMGNMGPALGEAGPVSNFAVYSRPGRLVLAGLMIVGRLEIFPVLMMFAAVSASFRRKGIRRPRIQLREGR